MPHKYHRYADTVCDEDFGNKRSNRIRYLAMAFRPAGTLLFCVCLAVIIAVPCVIIILRSPKDSASHTSAMAVLTGVVASGLVAVSVELANNYRHNLKRFVVLNEYLYMVSMYEQLVEWGSHGDYEPFDEQSHIDWCNRKLDPTPRMCAIAEVILEFGPVIEDAVKNGREFLSVKELQTATQAVDAADKLGEVTGEIICNHLLQGDHSIYDALDEPLRSKIKGFSKDVGICLANPDLESVVCDYFLTNIDELGTLSDDADVNELDVLSKNQIIHCLWSFDQAMHRLQMFAKAEPVVYENLVPYEKQVEKMERKLFGKEYDRIVASREERREREQGAMDHNDNLDID